MENKILFLRLYKGEEEHCSKQYLLLPSIY